jgi:hypothetical protein
MVYQKENKKRDEVGFTKASVREGTGTENRAQVLLMDDTGKAEAFRLPCGLSVRCLKALAVRRGPHHLSWMSMEEDAVMLCRIC